jgi:hypothetical protein
MKLFGKPKPKTPFYDLVVKSTMQAAAAHIEAKEKSPMTLGVVITLMNFNSVQNLIKPDKLSKGVVKLNPDVFAFEAAVFGLYAMRQAFEGERGDAFDESMDDVWRAAYGLLVSFADNNTGWETGATFRRRMMRYMHLGDLRKATDDFIATLNEINAATAPMPKYPGPTSFDLKQNVVLMASVHAFAANLPEGCAESLHRIMDHYGYKN